MVAVTIVRSGGIAGLTQRWSVTAPPSDPDRLLALVGDCPWGEGNGGDDRAASGPRSGADRFSWRVEATLPDAEHRAVIPETQATGPWRVLIDAVRTAAPHR